jgi:hypothetical protein
MLITLLHSKLAAILTTALSVAMCGVRVAVVVASWCGAAPRALPSFPLATLTHRRHASLRFYPRAVRGLIDAIEATIVSICRNARRATSGSSRSSTSAVEQHEASRAELPLREPATRRVLTAAVEEKLAALVEGMLVTAGYAHDARECFVRMRQPLKDILRRHYEYNGTADAVQIAKHLERDLVRKLAPGWDAPRDRPRARPPPRTPRSRPALRTADDRLIV